MPFNIIAVVMVLFFIVLVDSRRGIPNVGKEDVVSFIQKKMAMANHPGKPLQVLLLFWQPWSVRFSPFEFVLNLKTPTWMVLYVCTKEKHS